MNLESSLCSFVNRVNDAYMASHSMHDLINDFEYQKLVIKHGKPHGFPLGNEHLLPGYWFVAFVAPYESLQQVLDAKKYEEHHRQEKQQKLKKETENSNCMPEDNVEHVTKEAFLDDIVKRFDMDIAFMIDENEKMKKQIENSFLQNKLSLKLVMNAIQSGSYTFSKEDNMTCTFCENNTLCGYKVEAKIKVAILNQFAMDFSKQLVDSLLVIVENYTFIRQRVASMFIGHMLGKARD